MTGTGDYLQLPARSEWMQYDLTQLRRLMLRIDRATNPQFGGFEKAGMIVFRPGRAPILVWLQTGGDGGMVLTLGRRDADTWEVQGEIHSYLSDHEWFEGSPARGWRGQLLGHDVIGFPLRHERADPLDCTIDLWKVRYEWPTFSIRRNDNKSR